MTRLLTTSIRLAAAVCAVTAGPVFAQPEPPRVETRQGAAGTELTLNEINTEAYPDITIFATILKDGEPVTGLGAADFKVSEDEVEQSPLTVEPQLPPLSVVVTVDVSGSMSKRMDATKKAAADFVGRLGEKDAAQLVSFQREIATLTPMTTDKGDVVDAIGGLVARGDTALFDGLSTSLDLLAEHKGRKAVVLLSDGVDDDGTGKPLSKATVQQALERAARINVPVFVIGLGTQMDEAVLQQIAGATGGRYLPAPEASQLAAVYDSIGSQLSGQYAIRYTSSLPADGSARRVDLRAAGLVVAKTYTAPGTGAALGKPQDTGDCAVPTVIAAERPNLEKANDGYKRQLLSVADRNDVRKAAVRKIFAAADATSPGSIDCARDTLASVNALYDEKLIDVSDRNDLREPPTRALSGLCTTDGNLETLQRCLTFYGEFYDQKLIEIGTRNSLIQAAAGPYVEALGQLNDLDAALERVNQLYEMDAIPIATRNEIRGQLRDKFLKSK